MKILQVITLSDLGGAQTVLVELTNNLINLGHEVTVVSNSGGFMWNLLDERVKKVECPFFKREISPVNDVKALLFLKKIIEENEFSVIHLHSSKAGVWGRIAGSKYKDRIVYTVHGFDTILKANRIFLILEKYLAKKAKYIVPVSKYDTMNLMSSGITNLKMIYNGIHDIEEIGSNKNPFTLHKNPNDKVILTIARLQKPKNVELFLEVARRLGNKGYAFYWIGNQHELDNIPSNTFFLGQIPNARIFIRFADLFVLFSNYEGLPVSIIEAFASGIPVVASNVGGIKEMLNGDNGTVVENDVEEASAAIVKYANANNDKYRQEARKSYLNNYRPDQMVQNYLEIYREISELR